jgi:hypothetical protein
VAPRRRMDVADVDVVVAVGEDVIFLSFFLSFFLSLLFLSVRVEIDSELEIWSGLRASNDYERPSHVKAMAGLKSRIAKYLEWDLGT